jgi:hypothetical protein
VRATHRPTQRIVGWLLFLTWAVWLAALQGAWSRHAGGTWVPDAALVLAVVVLARCETTDLAPLALFTALARAATGGEPPLVLLAGAFGALFLALALRDALELSGPLGRSAGTAIAAGAFQAWLCLAHDARSTQGGLDLMRAATSALPVAIASALFALAIGPALARLPGLTPLRSRSW